MFGLNIFVRVQTFRRGPPVPPRNFCHPGTGKPETIRMYFFTFNILQKWKSQNPFCCRLWHWWVSGFEQLKSVALSFTCFFVNERLCHLTTFYIWLSIKSICAVYNTFISLHSRIVSLSRVKLTLSRNSACSWQISRFTHGSSWFLSVLL